ncbi:MAG TPA: hypothetical protein PK898_10545 [Flexilinea sp.]|nr:hypothetical protein [Flexilinea sp.]
MSAPFCNILKKNLKKRDKYSGISNAIIYRVEHELHENITTDLKNFLIDYDNNVFCFEKCSVELNANSLSVSIAMLFTAQSHVPKKIRESNYRKIKESRDHFLFQYETTKYFKVLWFMIRDVDDRIFKMVNKSFIEKYFDKMISDGRELFIINQY